MESDQRTRGLVEQLIHRVLKAADGYEFDSFVLGFYRPREYDRCEHEARYRSLKIAAGTALERCWPHANVSFDAPQLRIEIGAADLDAGFLASPVRLRPAPLFLGGRYRKLSREIPATRWIHHRCRGRGCPSCRYSGNLCGPSIQEILGTEVLRLCGGEETHLHALGREDTDALMLEGGRPFVLEVSRPKRRTLPLRELQQTVARTELAEILHLSRVDAAAMRWVKATEAPKSYRAWLTAAAALPADAAARLKRLRGVTIEQLSPRRVMHRRGRDRLRRKQVFDSAWLGMMGPRFVWETRVQAGTYVKELVSGDGGRTRPSVSELLGVSCRVAELDVIDIHCRPPWEGEDSPGENDVD